MAEIVPTEGLTYLVGFITGDTASIPSNLYLGLLTGGDGTTVPAASATLASMGGTISEYAGVTSYARVAVPTSDWGTIGSDTEAGLTGQFAAAAQKSFAAATEADADANITGFFLCTVSTGTSGVALYYSNFAGEATDVIASLALGDIVRVTPTFGLGDVAGVA